MEPQGLQDFQRNVGFVVIVIFGGFAVLVFLVSSLADLMIPLFWAAFFAVPLTALIARIDRLLTDLLVKVRGKLEGDEECREPDEGWEFTGQAGDNHITLSKADAKALLQKLAHTEPDQCKLCPSLRCCQGRVRLSKLKTDDGEELSGQEVDRLVVNWLYYIKEPDEGAFTDDDVQVELFLDQECTEYPAVITGTQSSLDKGLELKGYLHVDRTSVLSWSIAVWVAMMLMAVAIFVFFTCVNLGADALRDNADNYRKGIHQMITQFAETMKNFMPHDQIVKMRGHMEDMATKSLPGIASTATGKIESLGFDLMLFVLYIAFWVFEPIPISSNVAQVIKDYLLLKTVACLIYACLMGGLMYSLGCPIWHLFFVGSFLLNYIPEFGFIVVLICVIPAIALNSGLTAQQREHETAVAVIGSILIKVIVANIIEVKLYISKGGQYMRMHPVVLMCLMMFFQQFFGLTGMFLAIPMVATMKYYVLSADIPVCYLNPTLAFMEGDDCAPHKNFVDKHNTTIRGRSMSYGTTEPSEARSGV